MALSLFAPSGGGKVILAASPQLHALHSSTGADKPCQNIPKQGFFFHHFCLAFELLLVQ